MEVVMVYLWLNDVEFRYITVAAYGQIGRYLLNSRYFKLEDVEIRKFTRRQQIRIYVHNIT